MFIDTLNENIACTAFTINNMHGRIIFLHVLYFPHLSLLYNQQISLTVLCGCLLQCTATTTTTKSENREIA